LKTNPLATLPKIGLEEQNEFQRVKSFWRLKPGGSPPNSVLKCVCAASRS
jgi:hypothetical protein